MTRPHKALTAILALTSISTLTGCASHTDDSTPSVAQPRIIQKTAALIDSKYDDIRETARIINSVQWAEKFARNWGNGITINDDGTSPQLTKTMTAKQAIGVIWGNQTAFSQNKFTRDGYSFAHDTDYTGYLGIDTQDGKNRWEYPAPTDSVHQWSTYPDYYQYQFFDVSVQLTDLKLQSFKKISSNEWLFRFKWTQKAHIWATPPKTDRSATQFDFTPTVGTYEGVDELKWNGNNGYFKTISGSREWFLTPFVSGWKSRDPELARLEGAINKHTVHMTFAGGDFKNWDIPAETSSYIDTNYPQANKR